MTKIIFAIDNGSGLHTRAKFNRYLDTLKALGKLQGDVRIGVGHWVDDANISWLEDCYCMDRQDFEKHVTPHGWCNNQQCVLVVRAARSWLSKPTQLDAMLTSTGALRSVGPKMPAGDWTKFHDSPDYWKVEVSL
jgi:hypothetical protein